MSNTYKTKPNWVKINKPQSSREVRERHDHRHGECDIDKIEKERPFWWQNGNSCGYDVSYYSYHGGFYSRPPHGKEIRRLMEGEFRARWRAQRDEMLKLSREDIEDFDVKTYQHRHSALWEMF